MAAQVATNKGLFSGHNTEPQLHSMLSYQSAVLERFVATEDAAVR